MTNEGADTSERRDAIERRAYARYEARGREDGRDVEDWVEAEREVGGDTRPDPDAAETGTGPNVPIAGGEEGERAADVMPDVPSAPERNEADPGAPPT